ncbi:hypothetical protein A2422_02750 [Candidatus Woesebacteria bacterium RIFOXYC1_FULL_31_51]|uniref:SCP domain-containing protein n=1 Tax=Candidatus Woesebacteria bacterium GW2011_GWC2_31_9 TaxID=1618586 RepID=A0A0F9YXF0_9BACT|nr:MAG: hypothetical protein UR17_C0001G0054 [Candidatus Woesebacteria bacterium GW2011_GWF1_31_35]KKP23448.1 MAG: hypothetical protein UR11_C0001G0422 [Candidatus Woesebacteria bacterium GW2011_GWC1_30_29]KKP26425.1 MAG: hypothetical protein UR13_C0004G0039 [Candidatus Woesebacteria bacterium GW2011_GWD1_31_12]KKP27724.1 MAG: hypothetical protein UR16_C0002G0054 [Candidatus Woesebacteria bacterium GW2011_GWB1_31_29]KKP31131.1 MAG: hypothetical protein UR21_C0015G0005 [Candidatus Woesebacteria 
MNKNNFFKSIIISSAIFIFAFVFLAIPNLVKASGLSVENVYNEVNQTRIQNGQLALKKNNLLTLAAQRKAQDLISYGYWAHNNPTTGATPWKFILATGYRGRLAGENLGRDYGDTGSLIGAWLASPTHKQNLLSNRYKETGIALATGVVNGQTRTVIVQMFGEPRQFISYRLQ